MVCVAGSAMRTAASTRPDTERIAQGQITLGCSVADNAWFRTFADRVISVDTFAAPGGVFDPGGVATRADMAVMTIAAFPQLEATTEPHLVTSCMVRYADKVL